jgi:hypothetical protein
MGVRVERYRQRIEWGWSDPMASSEFSADQYDELIDETIASCDGNLRSAVRALLIANEHLETEISQLKHWVDISARMAAANQGYLN